MGGLSAAIYARLRGWDVLVIEQHDRPGGKAAGIETEGFWLDPGPSIIILTEIYDQVFRDAGRRPSDYLTFHRLDTLSRVMIEGGATIDLPSNADDCVRLLNDLAPSDVPAFRSMMERLDRVAEGVEDAVFRRPILTVRDFARPGLMRFGLQFNPFLSYRKMIDGWFQSPLLRAFFYGFPSYSGQTYDDAAPGALLIPYYMLRRGVSFPNGGVRQIPQAFYRLACELGVKFRFHTRFDSFVSDREIRLESGERLVADGVICNIDKLTALKQNEPTPSMSYFTLHYGVRGEVGNLDHHNLLVPRRFQDGFDALYSNRFPNPPIVYVNATQKLDSKAAPPGCTNLFAVVTVPAEGPEIDWASKRAEYRAYVKQRLEVHGLHWSDKDVVFERVQDPPYFQAQHGNYRGSLYGPIQRQRAFGLFPLANWDPQHPRRAFCGGSVQPGAGLPMVTLSGKFAVDCLAKVI